MGETMLVTQALDERDLLVKKITDKIEKASFVAWIPMMEMLILKGSFRRCKLRSNGMPVPLLRNGYSIFNGTKYC